MACLILFYVVNKKFSFMILPRINILQQNFFSLFNVLSRMQTKSMSTILGVSYFVSNFMSIQYENLAQFMRPLYYTN